MTVLVGLTTKDALVLGCDSLGTIPNVSLRIIKNQFYNHLFYKEY